VLYISEIGAYKGELPPALRATPLEEGGFGGCFFRKSVGYLITASYPKTESLKSPSQRGMSAKLTGGAVPLPEALTGFC